MIWAGIFVERKHDFYLMSKNIYSVLLPTFFPFKKRKNKNYFREDWIYPSLRLKTINHSKYKISLEVLRKLRFSPSDLIICDKKKLRLKSENKPEGNNIEL